MNAPCNVSACRCRAATASGDHKRARRCCSGVVPAHAALGLRSLAVSLLLTCALGGPLLGLLLG